MTQPCNVCHQVILQTPRQCFTCGQSITYGQKYRYRQARAGCEPVHEQCFSSAPSRVTVAAVEEGRLL